MRLQFHHVPLWRQLASWRSAILLGTCGCLHAATITWNNTNTGFTNGGSWVGNNAPANSLTTDIALFGTASPTNQPDLSTGSTRSVAGLIFASGAGAFTFSGSKTLNLGASGIVNNSSSTQTMTVSLSLGTASVFTTSGTGALNIQSTLDTGGFALS
ncbi:MAG: hypothetical protein ACREKL_13605, partial [Chthoniobacterales bacterium]